MLRCLSWTPAPDIVIKLYINKEWEVDIILENRTQFALKGKGERIVKVSISILTYPNQHTDTEIPHGSRDHIIVPDTIKTTFNLDIEWIDKTRNIDNLVNNVGRALVKRGANAWFKGNWYNQQFRCLSLL